MFPRADISLTVRPAPIQCEVDNQAKARRPEPRRETLLRRCRPGVPQRGTPGAERSGTRRLGGDLFRHTPAEALPIFAVSASYPHFSSSSARYYFKLIGIADPIQFCAGPRT
jgi:hypothetical protein